MASSHVHPRRRAAGPNQPHEPKVKTHTTTVEVNPLQKGSTFHSPTSPPAPDDPALHMQTIPHRSPTCPETLEALVIQSQERLADLINSIDRGVAGVSLSSNKGHKDESPVPKFLLDHAAAQAKALDGKRKSTGDLTEDTQKSGLISSHDHDHDSDSGLGSSVCSSVYSDSGKRSSKRDSRRNSVWSTVDIRGARQDTEATAHSKHLLSNYGAEKIRSLIVNPILAERKFKAYHPLVEDIPSRIHKGTITCLRDVEKTLIVSAPSKSKSASAYAAFCETSIQHIYTAVTYLNPQDQTRPSDRVYSNNYFVDLVEQVRQYACIMAATRKKQANGETLSKQDYSPNERVSIRGGASRNGKAPELVREKEDGEVVKIEGDKMEVPVVRSPVANDDVRRSMARKRKCDIGKVEWRSCRECGKAFTRPCDLTKHEKTHSRPWKCSEPSCKYYDLGWPTEKERDRHVNDRHSQAPKLFKCLFKGCAYTSKRESNCKQHMEKSHNWQYVRSKTQRSKVTLPTVDGSPAETSAHSPSVAPSLVPSASTPATPATSNPMFSPVESIDSAGFLTTSTASHTGSEQFLDGTFHMNQPLDFDLADAISPPLDGYVDSPEGSMPSAGFEFDDFGRDLDYSAMWPATGDFFPQYTEQPMQMQMQQPTPAWSDHDDFQMKPIITQEAPTIAGQQEHVNPALLTPGNAGDAMISGNTFGGQDFSFGGAGNNNFSLFEEALDQPGPSSISRGFSDLGGVGGKFAQEDPMYADMDMGNFESDTG